MPTPIGKIFLKSAGNAAMSFFPDPFRPTVTHGATPRMIVSESFR
jgi:hypothetical protein